MMASRVESPRTALVLGGNSDIAHAALVRLAADGLCRVVLAVRDADALQARLARSPLPISEVTVEAWDALDPDAHQPLVERSAETLDGIDLVLCAVGSLGHGAGIGASSRTVVELISANFAGPAAALTDVAHHLAQRGHGTIVVISSIAGVRARRSNYLYGSAKAGLDAFAQGLGDSVAADGVRVHVVRPGFVASKMTTGLAPAPFATDTAAVAECIAGVVRCGSSRIVHVPSPLGPLFALMRALPRPIWRRISGDR